jgi:hypothetical protein
LFALLVAACNGGDDTTAPVLSGQIAGHWTGTAEFGVQFSATFTQQGNIVGGSGSFTSPLGGGPFTVTSGQVTGADVSLVLNSPDFGSATYTGRFETADHITGHLAEPSFGQIVLALDRSR